METYTYRQYEESAQALREKLGEPPRKPRYVKTVWGVGYTVE